MYRCAVKILRRSLRSELIIVNPKNPIAPIVYKMPAKWGIAVDSRIPICHEKYP